MFIVPQVFLAQIILALIQQWIVPTVHNTMEPFFGQHYSVMLTRVLKLSVSLNSRRILSLATAWNVDGCMFSFCFMKPELPLLPLLPLLLIFCLHTFISFLAQTYLGKICRSEKEMGFVCPQSRSQ